MKMNRKNSIMSILVITFMVFAMMPVSTLETYAEPSVMYELRINTTYQSYDITGDGMSDTLRVNATDESGWIGGFAVEINGETVFTKYNPSYVPKIYGDIDPASTYYPTLKYVKLENGQPLLYIHLTTYNGYYGGGWVYKYDASSLNVILDTDELIERRYEECGSNNGYGRPQEILESLERDSLIFNIDDWWDSYGLYKYRCKYQNGEFVISRYQEETELDKLLKTRPSIYNKDLALISADLCLKTYSDQDTIESHMKNEYGCTDCYSDNYDSGVYAYTIGKKQYSDDTELLIIAAQGSTTPHELCKDATAGTKGKCDGYDTYDFVDDFYDEIVDGIEYVTELDKHYIVFLTGHSLGGAVTNLLSARIINGDINRRLSTLQNATVFCYTFGSVNCIKSDLRVEFGYENIHNIYNWLDTFSPKQYGAYLMTGMGNGKGKFGRLESFWHEYRSTLTVLLVRDPMKQIMAAINHDMHNYYDAVKNGYVSGATTDDGETDLVNRYVVIACPVDIEVYNKEKIIGRVVNDIVDSSVTNLIIWVQDSSKYMILPPSGNYSIVIKSRDKGTMSFAVQDLTGSGEVTSFTNVSLRNGKQLSSNIGSAVEIPAVELDVINHNGETIAEVRNDGSETACKHDYEGWKETRSATELRKGIRVRTCRACGASETKEIAALAPTLKAVKISKPKAGKKSVTVKWKKISKKNQKMIQKIEIQYSTDKKFKKGVKTVYAKKIATSKKIKKLKSKKKYYVRIRAYKKSGKVVHISKWSTVKPFKVK